MGPKIPYHTQTHLHLPGRWVQSINKSLHCSYNRQPSKYRIGVSSLISRRTRAPAALSALAPGPLFSSRNWRINLTERLRPVPSYPWMVDARKTRYGPMHIINATSAPWAFYTRLGTRSVYFRDDQSVVDKGDWRCETGPQNLSIDFSR